MRAIKHRGLYPHRFRDNPEEKAFAQAWEKLNEEGHLALLLDVGGQGRAPEVKQRDATVAATTIQWLGSPVGQYWLEELGYKKTNPRR